MKRRDLLKLFVAAPILPYLPTPDTVPAMILPGETVLYPLCNQSFYATHIQRINISADLNRTPLNELGYLEPYHRYTI